MMRPSNMMKKQSSSSSVSSNGRRRVGNSRRSSMTLRTGKKLPTRAHRGSVLLRGNTTLSLNKQSGGKHMPPPELVLTPNVDPFSPDSMFEYAEENRDRKVDDAISRYQVERSAMMYESHFAVFRFMLMEGAILMKLDENGRPRGKFFCLNIVGNLHWHDMPLDSRELMPSPNFIRMQDVQRVVVGKQTAGFRAPAAETISEELCFSLVTENLTLDIRVRNPRMRDMWTRGLMMVQRRCMSGMTDMITGGGGIDTMVHDDLEQTKVDGMMKLVKEEVAKEAVSEKAVAKAALNVNKDVASKKKVEKESTQPPAAPSKRKKKKGKKSVRVQLPESDKADDDDEPSDRVAAPMPDLEPPVTARAVYPPLLNGQNRDGDKEKAKDGKRGAESSSSSVKKSSSDTSVASGDSNMSTEMQVDELTKALGMYSFSSDKDLIKAVAKPRAFLRFVSEETPSILFVRLTQSHIYFGPSGHEVDVNNFPLSSVVTVGAGKLTSTFRESDDELTPPECCLSIIAEEFELNLQLESKKKRNKWVAAVATLVSLHV